MSRDTISRIENDRLDNVPAGTIQRCVEALGAYLRMDIAWQGERLPRLIDARHAALQNTFVALLAAWGWDTRVEVSFNHYGDRGRVDIVGYYAATRTLAIVEIKPDIDDAQETVGRLDVKVRLGRTIAAEAGWTVDRIVPVLVLENGASPRRHVRAHEGLFRRFTLRGASARAWLRAPSAEAEGLLLFVDARSEG